MSSTARSRAAHSIAFVIGLLVLPAILVILGWIGRPSSALAADPARSHIFIDGVDFPGLGGKAYAIDSPADGLLEGALHDLFTEIPGDAFKFWVNPTNPDLDGDGFEITFVAPPGEVLAVGDYEAEHFPDGLNGLAYLDVDTPGSTECTPTGASFSVHEVSYAGAGTPLAFAATFSFVCSPSQWVAGEIRFDSTVPYTGRTITPPSLAFDRVELGDVGPSQAVRIENEGTLPLDVTGAAVEGPFTITDDICVGTTIDPGGGCDVMVASAPVTAGTTGGRLTISDGSAASGHRVGLSGVGFATTTTTLTSDRNPGIHPDEIATLTATVSPIPDGGRVEFCIVGGTCSQSVLVSSVTGKATMAWLKQSGTVDIIARYLGRTYFSPSQSQAISQTSKRRLPINLWVDPVAVPPDHPVAVAVDVIAGSGTTTLTDELTGDVIFSSTEPSATPSFHCLFPSEPGIHRMRVDHSGDGADIVPSMEYIDVTVAEGQVARGGPMTVPINVGDPYCMTLGVGIPSISATANLTLEPRAVGSEEFTEVRLSNNEEVTEFGVLIDGATYPYGGSIDWSLTESAGGEDGDGQKTIWFQFRKASGTWSPLVAAHHVYLDRTIPSGTASLAGGAAYTTSTTVTVATAATDSGSGLSQVALSNDGVAWTNRTYASSQAWTLISGQGNKTVHVKWKDAAGNWSVPKSDGILLDSVAPAGTVAIASGATYARTNMVTIATTATDTGSGLGQVALSNDGVSWTSRSYAASQSWTLSSGNGTKTVWVKWKDAAGNWSAAKTDTIVLDTVGPTVTALRRGFVAGTAISSGKITLRVPWSGSDVTSGIARYELAQSTDGGTWTTISTTLTSPTATRSLAALHTYRFRVRAVDQASNTGAWATGPIFRISRYSEFNTAITYSGSWTTVSNAAYWGGGAKKSSTAGAKASLTFTGRSFAWVARIGPNRGKAAIYVNGTKVATVDLYSATAGPQRVVWVGTWTTAISRKVTIRVAGTSGRPRIDLDALVTAN